jgi:hypothetical protein
MYNNYGTSVVRAITEVILAHFFKCKFEPLSLLKQFFQNMGFEAETLVYLMTKELDF